MPDPTTDPTPTPEQGTPRLAETMAHLAEAAEAAELGGHWAGRAFLAHLGRQSEETAAATVDARRAVARAREALDAAQLAILGLDADPEADLAPVAVEPPTSAEIANLAEIWRRLPNGMSGHGFVNAVLTMFVAGRNGTVALAEVLSIPAPSGEERCASCGHDDHGDMACGEILMSGARAGRNCPCGWTSDPAALQDKITAEEVLELLERNRPNRPVTCGCGHVAVDHSGKCDVRGCDCPRAMTQVLADGAW